MKENTQHSLRHGSKKANIEKNQNPRIIPCKDFLSVVVALIFNYSVTDDFNRVVLEPDEGIPDSDYVNASYVDVRISGHGEFGLCLL